MHDLQWLHQSYSKYQFLPYPVLDFARWEEHVKNFPLGLGRLLDAYPFFACAGYASTIAIY